MGHRITVESHMANLCGRNQGQNTVYHSKAGTKHRNDSQFFTGDKGSLAGLDRSLNLHILGRKIAERLVAHKNSDLLHQLTKLVGSGILVSQH